MKLRVLVLFVVGLLMISCSAKKIEVTPQQIAALDELVESRSYVITSEYALPLVTNSISALQNSGVLAPGENPGRISLINNPNDLTVNGEVVTSKLPYFGEIQQSSGYNGSNSSIEFNGNYEDYSATKNDDNTYTIKFDARSKSEKFDVTITLFPNLRSQMTIKGNKRFPIRYTGFVKGLDPEPDNQTSK